MGLRQTIVYNDQGGCLYRVASTGGEPELLLAADSIAASRAHVLPNGRGVVFDINPPGANPLASRILLLELETGAVRELVASGNQPRYVPTGHLIYGHGGGALMGVPFDLETLEVTGAPVTLLPSLAVFSSGASQFGVSENGTLIYATSDTTAAGPSTAAPLLWVDLAGNETPLPLRQESARTPRISPDGRRIAYESGGQIWLYDIEAGTNTQFTFEGAHSSPIWSTDGRLVYFMSTRPGTQGADAFVRAADGGSEAVQLWRREGTELALTSLTPDGSWLVIGESQRDISLASLGTDSVLFRDYLESEAGEYGGAISPDGRWMAYTSNEVGGEQVFVRGFPERVGQWQVSVERGFEPVWAPNGSALYFVTPPNLVRVDVASGGTFSFGSPTVLFRWSYDPATELTIGYDIHPDGDRFLFARGTQASAVYIVTNWFEELRQLMGS